MGELGVWENWVCEIGWREGKMGEWIVGVTEGGLFFII